MRQTGVLALLVALVPLAFCWPRTEDEKKCSTDAFQKALGESESTRDDLVFMAEFSRFMNFKAPNLLQEFAERKKMFDARKKLTQLEVQANLFRQLLRIKDPILRSRRHTDDTEVMKSCEKPVIVCADSMVEKESTRDDTSTTDAPSSTTDATTAASDTTTEDATTTTTAADPFSTANATDATTAASDMTTTAAPSDTNDAADDATEKPHTQLGQAAAQFTTDLIGAVTNSTTGVIDIFTDIVSSVGGVLEENVPASAWNYLCIATWYPIHAEHCSGARCSVCNPAIESAKVVCMRSGMKATHHCIEKIMGEGFCNFCINDYLGH